MNFVKEILRKAKKRQNIRRFRKNNLLAPVNECPDQISCRDQLVNCSDDLHKVSVEQTRLFMPTALQISAL